MSRYRWFVIFLITLGIFSVGLIKYTDLISSPAEDVQAMSVSEIGEQLHTLCSSPKRLGWIPYWDQKRASVSFRANADLFSHISLFWYYLDQNGHIQKYRQAQEDRKLLGFARKHGVKVLALVANDDDNAIENWDRDRVARIISDPELRSSHIEDLVQLTERLNFDGINIDYEALHRRDFNDFTRFIDELATALHDRDKILAVAIHPKTAIADPEEDNGSHAQDLIALARSADQLHLMTYGEHGDFSDPGPIASGRWLDDIFDFVLDEQGISANKLFVGIPTYGQAWEESTCEDKKCIKQGGNLVYEDVVRRRRQVNDAQLNHDGVNGALLRYSMDDLEMIIWYEDAKSMLAKLYKAARRGVCNSALWRLGGEDKDIWQALRNPRDVLTSP